MLWLIMSHFLVHRDYCDERSLKRFYEIPLIGENYTKKYLHKN